MGALCSINLGKMEIGAENDFAVPVKQHTTSGLTVLWFVNYQKNKQKTRHKEDSQRWWLRDLVLQKRRLCDLEFACSSRVCVGSH